MQAFSRYYKLTITIVPYGIDSSSKLPLRGVSGPNLIHGSLDWPESLSQRYDPKTTWASVELAALQSTPASSTATASWLVQLFLAKLTADCPYTLQWAATFPTKKCQFSRVICTPGQYMVPWAHPTQPPKRHLDPFSRFRRAHERDQQTDIQTDQPTDHNTVYSNRPLSLVIAAMRPKN